MADEREYTPQQIAIIIRKKAEKAARENAEREKAEQDNNQQGTERPLIEGMHLAKIRNRYMFDSDDPYGVHTYAVYSDEKTKEVRAIETTHLYKVDEKNMGKVKRGLLLKVHFDGYETPSGVNNTYYGTNVDGNPIDISHGDVYMYDKPIAENQAKDIKAFANRERKRFQKEKP